MKFILLNGSSCSGKSTITKNIMKEKDDFFQLSYDSIKWLFSDYTHVTHGKDVQRLLYAIAESVFKMNFNVVCDSVVDRKLRRKLVVLAKRHGYSVLEINLEADYRILSRRFDERVARALSDPESKIANTSKERFKRIHDAYHKDKNPRAVTFRTDTQTVEELSKKILKMI